MEKLSERGNKSSRPRRGWNGSGLPSPWCGLKEGKGAGAEEGLCFGLERRQDPPLSSCSAVDQSFLSGVGQGLCLINQQSSELGHQECSTGWVLWSPLYDAGSEQTGWKRGWLVCGSSLLKSEVTDLSCALCEAVSPTSGVRGVREYDGEKV